MNDFSEKTQEINTHEFVSDSESITQADEMKLRRKINRAFAPFVFIISFTQFVDKITINSASALTLFEDTGITHSQFSWLGSFFYLGYLCMQPLNNIMMQKVQISKYVGSVLLIWGAVLASTASATNFSQLAALRFSLGFFEAVSYPSMFLLVATFYRRSEQVFWIGSVFLSNSIASMVGSLICYGIGYMPTVGQITPWKWIMIIFGCFTCVVGFIFFFFLPDTPYSRWFHLTEKEKKIIELRVRDNAVVPSFRFNWDHIKESLSEPRFYCYCAISFLVSLQNGGFTLFGSLIIKGMGFSSLNAIALGIPLGAVVISCILLCAYLNKRFNQIIYPAVLAMILSIISVLILICIPTGGIRLIGYYLNGCNVAGFALLQSSISANASGYTKKIFYTGANMVFYTLGNFSGSLVMVDKQAPRYLGGMGCYLGANVVALVLFLYVRYNLCQLNKKRNVDLPMTQETLIGAIEDLTDVQNKNFVYKL